VSDQGYGADYDTIVRWEKRLAREAPLFERLFDKHDVSTVADVGCGTGQHAIMFAKWGLDVFALDPSPEMLDQARANAADAGVAITFAEEGFGHVADVVGSVDAAVSLGNALPHVADIADFESAMADLGTAIRSGGVLVLHFLNHDRLDQQNVRMLPPVIRETDEGETIVLKVIDHEPDHYVIEFTGLKRSRPAERDDTEASDWDIHPRCSRHTKLLSGTVRHTLEGAGFGEIEVLGDHSGRPLDEAADESAIWVATRL
jgi:SAM-dependent methyltransferase